MISVLVCTRAGELAAPVGLPRGFEIPGVSGTALIDRGDNAAAPQFAIDGLLRWFFLHF